MGMALPVPQFTIEMLDDFPDDGNRYELLEGMLLVTPAPSLTHQLVATRLATILSHALRVSGRAHVVAVGALQRGEIHSSSRTFSSSLRRLLPPLTGEQFKAGG